MGSLALNPIGSKKPASLSINAALLLQARREQWLAENQAALDDYNRRVDMRGVFSDGLRRF